MSSTTTVTMSSEKQQQQHLQQPQAPDLSKHPKLTREQAGHLRHFHNLVSQPDNDRNLMGSQEPLREFLDAHRYQLATMAYAAELAHYRRQPALRSVHKKLIRQTTHKMLLRAVWAYWLTQAWRLIGMRLRDARLGTSVVDDVLEKYKAAWEKKGLVGSDGLLPDAWMFRQDFTIRPKDPAWTAWGSAFMNSWNGSLVKSALIRLLSVGNEFRKLVKEDGAAPDSQETLQRAVENEKEAEAGKKDGFPYTKPMFGYTVQWLSELGKEADLTALLDYADKKLRPQWERGGLYYPRNDEPFDEEMRWTHMDPFSGNAAIGYARLNVEDGQKIIWERPWTAKDVSTRPFVDAITLADGVDFLRGDWSEEEKMLVLTVRSWDGSTKTMRPSLRNLGPGTWNVFVDGQLRLSRTLSAGEDIALEVQVGHWDLDIVAVKQLQYGE
ncbi:hypothetical protein CSAL01_05674 [Colletotrichum salicis]|uniref:Linalool dehydratase/isomerase domain-containing protein n=1 Tax=Colletotrichum salicis TaxID=1209931 RepID=A0A135V1J9_9PEZI|nr:hypothetical protein CSAL01_05674 [Colletotrichum salicis]